MFASKVILLQRIEILTLIEGVAMKKYHNLKTA